MTLEIILFLLYLAAGPGLWILLAVGAASSRRRMKLFQKSNPAIVEPAPRVTIIIPAKDEGERIRPCLASALAQDYPNFDVLAVDDRSGDATGAIMDEIAAADARAKVLHIKGLPSGWTGKNHALFSAGSYASGDWLLFIDSDVILQPAALSTTLRVAIARRFDLVSLILKQETRGFWESALVPIASATFGAAYMMGLGNSESNKYFFGNGQFMLFDRKIYNQIGGHEVVKTQFNEDMALARIMKQAGLRPRMAWGSELGSVRMYDSLPTIMRGWSRIFFGSSGGSPWRCLLAIILIFLGGYLSIPAILWGAYRVAHPVGICNGYPWIGAVAAQWALITALLAVIYRWMGVRAIYAAASIITGLFVLAILFCAVWMCITGRVSWRGTSYSHKIQSVKSRS